MDEKPCASCKYERRSPLCSDHRERRAACCPACGAWFRFQLSPPKIKRIAQAVRFCFWCGYLDEKQCASCKLSKRFFLCSDQRERRATCTPSSARDGSDSCGARAAVSTINKQSRFIGSVLFLGTNRFRNCLCLFVYGLENLNDDRAYRHSPCLPTLTPRQPAPAHRPSARRGSDQRRPARQSRYRMRSFQCEEYGSLR